MYPPACRCCISPILLRHGKGPGRCFRQEAPRCEELLAGFRSRGMRPEASRDRALTPVDLRRQGRTRRCLPSFCGWSATVLRRSDRVGRFSHEAWDCHPTVRTRQGGRRRTAAEPKARGPRREVVGVHRPIPLCSHAMLCLPRRGNAGCRTRGSQARSLIAAGQGPASHPIGNSIQATPLAPRKSRRGRNSTLPMRYRTLCRD